MSDPQQQPLLHSIGAAANRLGEVSVSMIWRLIRSGELQPLRMGGRTFIPETELVRFIENKMAAQCDQRSGRGGRKGRR